MFRASGNINLTVIRAQEGTTARAFDSGDKAELRFTSGTIDEIRSDNTVHTNIFTTANNSTTDFTLSDEVANENDLVVFIDGVFQAHNTFSVSGTTLTLATAPASGRVVTVYSIKGSRSASNVALATMTGDNSDTTLTLPVEPINENSVQVFFDGVYQNKDSFSISGTTLTFGVAPPTGVAVEALVFTKLAINTSSILSDTDADTKVQVEESSDEDKIRFDTGGTERMIIDDAGKVGLGTTSPVVPLDILTNLSSDTTSSPDTVLTIATKYASTSANGAAGAGPRLEFKIPDDETNPITGAAIAGLKENGDDSVANAALAFYTSQNDTTLDEAMRIDSSGKVGIGTTSPDVLLDVRGEAAIAYDATYGLRFYNQSRNNWASIGNQATDNTAYLVFKSGGGETLRLTHAKEVMIGKTTTNFATAGIRFQSNGNSDFTRDDGNVININRTTSNGSLIGFYQDGTEEGTISVSGTNVSYLGFTGTHESSGIAADTAIGTVCSTIDELDTYVSGNKEGQTRTDHAKIKVSDTVGDARVYGILSSYSETNNKPIVASVGISSVLVTGACEGGDLLESNGDGTAKVQDDDIIRSKTIGKVTIGNSTTDVKLVSCVLYCG